jgi:GTP-binding protein HflX
VEQLAQTWMAKTNGNALFISATSKINIEDLRTRVSDMVKTCWFEKYPHSHDFF